MQKVTSAQNPFIKKVKKLVSSKKDRDQENLIVLDGIHLVEEWIKHHSTDLEIIVSESFTNAEEYKAFQAIGNQTIVPDDLLAKIAPTKTPQGILGLVPKPELKSPPDIQTALILDHLQDPGNVGTILRTAVATGCDAVFLYECTDIWSPKCLRAGQGAQLNPNIYCIEAEPKKIQSQFKGNIYGLSLEPDSQNFFEANITDPKAFALGNEGQGLSTEIQSLCSEFLYIPMKNECESLNVGVTAGICLFRQ